MAERSDPQCDIRVGTSGYDYPEWEGPFYARGLGRAEYLGAYSESFGTVELAFPGPGAPDPGSLLAVAGKARRPLDVALQAGPALTRDVDPAGWKAAARLFSAGLESLAAEGRLCGAVVAFPASFRSREDEHIGRAQV